MPYRTLQQAVQNEQATAVTAQLASATPTQLPQVFPKQSNNLNIVWLHIIISATITQSSGSAWTVGSLIKQFQIYIGSTQYLIAVGEDQLEKIFHMVTGLPIGATINTAGPNGGAFFYNPTIASGTYTGEEEIFIPLYYPTQGIPPVITLIANGYNSITNATAATLSLEVEFGYSTMPVAPDSFRIVTTPSALNTDTDIQVDQFFNDQNPLNEVWMEVTEDDDIDYQTFQVGNNNIYYQEDENALIALEVREAILYSHITAFFKFQMPPNTLFQSQGQTSTANKLLVNLATSRSPTFYLWETPSTLSQVTPNAGAGQTVTKSS